MTNITTNHTITYTNPAHVRGLIVVVVVVVVVVVDDDTIVFTSDHPFQVNYKVRQVIIRCLCLSAGLVNTSVSIIPLCRDTMTSRKGTLVSE